MRNPERIATVLDAVREAWERHPDLRLGQLILIASAANDAFYIEDDEMVEALKRFDVAPPAAALEQQKG